MSQEYVIAVGYDTDDCVQVSIGDDPEDAMDCASEHFKLVRFIRVVLPSVTPDPQSLPKVDLSKSDPIVIEPTA